RRGVARFVGGAGAGVAPWPHACRTSLIALRNAIAAARAASAKFSPEAAYMMPRDTEQITPLPSGVRPASSEAARSPPWLPRPGGGIGMVGAPRRTSRRGPGQVAPTTRPTVAG